jgi:hypothetical protein
MRWRIPLALVLLAFVAVSCDQQPVEPIGEQSVAEAPTFDFTNNPDNGNPRIFRYENQSLSTWVFPADVTPDGEAWILVEGIDDFNEMFFCGGDGTDTPASVQEVYIDERIIVNLMRKKSPAYAFHLDDFEANYWCNLSGYELAAGAANWKYNDNDATVVTSNNVWSGLLNAQLEDVATGEKYHAHCSFTYQIQDGEFRVNNENCWVK